jgi:thiol:disulfide interchange protein
MFSCPMTVRFSRRILVLASLAALLAPRAGADPEYPKMGPDVYDSHASGSAQIAAAFVRASVEHKRVLLVFGANWCIWCHRLHTTFQSDPAVSRILKDRFIVVDIDVNTRNGTARNADIVERYKNPIRLGLPVLVVLGEDGNPLCTKDSGELEEGEGHSPAKITRFLAEWVPY